jgi:hypothetical protein
VQRRKEWFELFGETYLALWWIEAGHIPTGAEGGERLAHLDRFGPTAYAFNFRKSFPPVSGARPIGEAAAAGSHPERLRTGG